MFEKENLKKGIQAFFSIYTKKWKNLNNTTNNKS